MSKIVRFKTKEDDFMLSVIDVARYLLSLGSMNHRKLQKLCYYVQAFYLAITGEPLMNTEFQAWAHGPVSPQLYYYYKSWGYLKIIQIVNEDYITKIPQQIRNFINSVYKMYENYSADDLEALTHSEEPWIKARESAGAKPGEACTKVITNDSMKIYYKKFFT